MITHNDIVSCLFPTSIFRRVFFSPPNFLWGIKLVRAGYSRRRGSCKFTCWFSGRFSEAFGGLSCVRLLSGEKTPLCKNICRGNGCQTPFCGLRLLSCAEIVIGFHHFCRWKKKYNLKKKTQMWNMERLSGPQLPCVFIILISPPRPPWNRLFLTVLPASACTLRRVMKRRCLTWKGTTMHRKLKVLFYFEIPSN